MIYHIINNKICYPISSSKSINFHLIRSQILPCIISWPSAMVYYNYAEESVHKVANKVLNIVPERASPSVEGINLART